MVALTSSVSCNAANPPLAARQVEVVNRTAQKTALAALAVFGATVMATAFFLAGAPMLATAFLVCACVATICILCDDASESYPVVVREPSYRTWTPWVSPPMYVPSFFSRPYVPTYMPPCVRIAPPVRHNVTFTPPHTRVGGGHVVPSYAPSCVAPTRIIPPVRAAADGAHVVVGARR